MPRLKIPAALAGGSSTETVALDADTLGELFDAHAQEYDPALRKSVLDEDGIKEFINVYVDGTETDDLDRSLSDDALIRVMPAASGGQER